MRAFPLIAVAALAVACSARVQKPAQERKAGDTTFPHSAHAEAAACVDCHEAIPKAARLGEAPLPTVDKCNECHDDPKNYSPPAREKRTDYTINFSHPAHLAKLADKKGDDACKVCHTVLPEPGELGRVTPPMDKCTACHHHEVEVAEAKCTPCHVSLKRFRVEPITQFTEFSHSGNFIKEHQRLAKNSAETCAQCHDQTYCATCHATATAPLKPELRFPENVRSDFIHRGDYVGRHHLEAERDPASCRKCHGSQFCQACHEAQGLSRGLSGAGPGRSPHPAGYAAGSAHGRDARKNIVGCAGCHDQGAGSICVSCHTVGGVGGNPHPSGWNKERGDISKNSMCRACHTR